MNCIMTLASCDLIQRAVNFELNFGYTFAIATLSAWSHLFRVLTKADIG